MRADLLPDGLFGGRPSPTYANTKVVLASILEGLHDEFACSMSIRSPVLGGVWRPLGDELYSAVRQHLVDTHSFDPGLAHIRNALRQICWENRYDSLADELRAMKIHEEDAGNTKLCSSFFADYLGVEPSPLARAKSRAFFRCIVGRALNPGAVCDTVFVLVGPQGGGKSSMGRILAGNPARFSDQDLVRLSAREQQEALCGRWIIEAPELGDLMSGQPARTKAFISRTSDRARPAWGTATVDQLRRFFLYATTNEPQFFDDASGSRRFVIVRCGRINLDAIQRDRDRLLAQAVEMHARGYPLRMPQKHWDAVAIENQRYFDDDPLIDLLAGVEGLRVKAELRLAFDDVWTAVAVPPERRTKAMKRRLVQCMTRLGWEPVGEVMRIGKRTCRSGFRKSAS